MSKKRFHKSLSEIYDSADGLSVTEKLNDQLHRYPDRCHHRHRKHIRKHLWRDRCFNDYDNPRNKTGKYLKKHHWSDTITYSIGYSYEIPRADVLANKSQKYRKKADEMSKRFSNMMNGYPRRSIRRQQKPRRAGFAWNHQF